MRIRIKSHWNPQEPYRIELSDGIISVRRRPLGQVMIRQKELRWTWHDDTEYAVRCPTMGIGRKPVWDILEDETIVCTGRLVHPSFKDTFLRAATPHLEWSFGDQQIIESTRCCQGDLRLAGGERLATWRVRRHVHVVLRDINVASMAPVVVGMVIGSLYDADGSSS